MPLGGVSRPNESSPPSVESMQNLRFKESDCAIESEIENDARKLIRIMIVLMMRLLRPILTPGLQSYVSYSLSCNPRIILKPKFFIFEMRSIYSIEAKSYPWFDSKWLI